ncbi:PTS sugar transporter subunit IIA [Amycolatopsis kentuckyensis]|uniref:PTS sugar transporter subunit IIA n=1 Tax=Amycolatopsis kentuckyensis TaxID=218823 RepID=UPI000A3AAE5F|nr:fructose PTS transporter subunit IIA [Amycolatopsis kentuckyensis]
MTTPDLITADLVDLGLDAADKQGATRALAQRLLDAGRVTDLELFLKDVAAREEQMATGLEGGIGIPHCRSAAVTAPTLAFGRSAAGVDFGAPDGPATLIFLIAAPEGGGSEHLKVLAALARRLVRAEFKQNLLDAADPAAVAEYIRQEVA